MIIDATGLHCFTNEYHYRFVDLNAALGKDGYCCVALCPTGNKLFFGLQRGKIVSFNMQENQISNFTAVTPVGDAEVQLAGIWVDAKGFVFVSDRNGKAVSMFDREGVCFTRADIKYGEPGFIYAHVREGYQSFFLNTGTAVQKYNIARGDRYSKIYPQSQYEIDKQSLEVQDFLPGSLSIHGRNLCITDHIQKANVLLVRQHDVRKGTWEKNLAVDAPYIRGVQICNENLMVVCTDDTVHLLERAVTK